MGEYSKKKSPAAKGFIILFIIIALVLTALLVLKLKYTVNSVTVTGNSHYTVDEIKSFVMNKSYEHNSAYLYMKYHDKSIENIPFVEKIDVDIISPEAITISVYEKALAGYVDYLGHYMYFDREGIVVESSLDKIESVPFVTGLEFEHVVLNEPLPVKDASIFNLILNITQLLNKYEIETDRISFDSEYNITLCFGDARVSLGQSDSIDEKINEMHLLLPKLYGYKGVLHMENYTGDEVNFSFDKDKDSAAVENIIIGEGDDEPSENENTENLENNEDLNDENVTN